jgi:hypothetical protein
MSLTTNDLKKIRGVVREEVEAEVGNAKRDLDSSISSVRLRNSYELTQVNNRLKNLEVGQGRLESGQKKIQKSLDYAVNFLDKQDIKTEKRIEKIERKLDIQPAI